MMFKIETDWTGPSARKAEWSKLFGISAKSATQTHRKPQPASGNSK